VSKLLTNELIYRIYTSPKEILEDEITWIEENGKFKINATVQCDLVQNRIRFHGWFNPHYKQMAFNLIMDDKTGEKNIIRYDEKIHPSNYRPTGDSLDGPHKHIGSEIFGDGYTYFKVNNIPAHNPNQGLEEFFKELNITYSGIFPVLTYQSSIRSFL